MFSLDGQVPLSVVAEPELLLAPDLFPEQGIRFLEFLPRFGIPCVPGPYYAVYLDRILSVDDPPEVFRIQFPSGYYLFKGVDPDGVPDRLLLGGFIRIAGDCPAERGECKNGVEDENYEHYGGDDADYESYTRKPHAPQLFVRPVIDEVQPEIIDFIIFILS